MTTTNTKTAQANEMPGDPKKILATTPKLAAAKKAMRHFRNSIGVGSR